MPKRSLVVTQIILVAVLVALWGNLIHPGSTKSADIHSSTLHTQMSGNAGAADVKATVALSVGQQETMKVLAKLSQLARDIEHGRVRLKELRERKGEPDSLLWDLRVLVHSDSKALEILQAFLGSDQEPIAARIMAVYSLAQPRTQAAVELLAKVIWTSKNVMLANAACMAGDAYAGDGIGRAWNYLLGFLTYLGLPEPFRFDSHYGCVYRPKDLITDPLFTCTSDGMDYSPIVRAMMDLLSNPSDEVMRGQILSQVRGGLQRPECTQEDRARFFRIAESSYLSADAGWQDALDILARRKADPANLELLAKGMPKLDAKKKLTVLNEVAALSPSAIFSNQFSAFLPDAVDQLSKGEDEGGPSSGTFSHICWSLVTEGKNTVWSSARIADSSSPVFRQRIVQVMQGEAASGNLTEPAGRRVLELSMMMLKDPEPKIRLSSAWTLHALSTQPNSWIGDQEKLGLVSQLSQFVKQERVSASKEFARSIEQLERALR